MDAYTSFAQVYDMFMDNIPYDEWCEYIRELLKDNGVNDDSIVLELGCGTGKVTRRLNKYGYSMIGIDNSEEMLSIAKEHSQKNETDDTNIDIEDNSTSSDTDILYLFQDMREFELYGTVGAIISVCDSINYITSEDDLLNVFKLVNNYLDKDGIFIFDLNTEYKYSEILADNTIAENREESSFIWDNYYYEDENINEYQLTIYIRDNIEDNGNTYKRYDETHYQKAYSISKVKELLDKAGMEFVAVYDAFTKEAPKEDSERIYVIAKEGFQKNKIYK